MPCAFAADVAGAALADDLRWADFRLVVPAAFAFGVGAGAHLHAQGAAGLQLRFGGDEDKGQLRAQAGEQGVVFGRGGDGDFGLQGSADLPGFAQGFDFLVGHVADFAQALPFGQQGVVARRQVVEGFKEDGLAGFADEGPGFFGGEAQKGRHPAQHGLGDVP